VSKLRTVRLTLAEARHLLHLLYECREGGDYFGNRVHYYARTDMLIAKIEDAAHGPEEEGDNGT